MTCSSVLSRTRVASSERAVVGWTRQSTGEAVAPFLEVCYEAILRCARAAAREDTRARTETMCCSYRTAETPRCERQATPCCVRLFNVAYFRPTLP
eukprot:9470991-Pyramimonas_sp.AAC.1